MSLKDLIAADFTNIFCNTEESGATATLKASGSSTGTTVRLCSGAPGTTTDLFEGGRESTTNITLRVLTADATAALSRELDIEDTFTIGNSVYKVVSVNPDGPVTGAQCQLIHQTAAAVVGTSLAHQ